MLLRLSSGFALGVMLGLSLGLWAQQSSLPDNPSPQSPPANESSGASSPRPKQAGSSSSGTETEGPRTSKKPSDLKPPRSDRVERDDLGDDVGESSSKDTQVDLSPPEDDAKKHPDSSSAIAAAEAEATGVAEFHPWDPHKAAKDVEVGDFYFKRKNYRAAEDRYREALLYKDNDATATFRLGECLEKLGQPGAARDNYESYLKILPHGAFAEEARKSVERLKKLDSTQKPTK
jgi:tetratricopeptide (TPR) repeat protein